MKKLNLPKPPMGDFHMFVPYNNKVYQHVHSLINHGMMPIWDMRNSIINNFYLSVNLKIYVYKKDLNKKNRINIV